MLIFAVINDKDLLWYRYFTFLVANNRGVLVMSREIIEDILLWCFLHSHWNTCNTLQTIFLSLLLLRFKIPILVFRTWRFISYPYCSLSMLSYMCDQMMILKPVMNNKVSKFFRKFPFMRSVLRVFCGAVYFAVWLTHHCFLHHKHFEIRKRVRHFCPLGTTNLRGPSVRQDDLDVSIDVHEACAVLFWWVSV